MDLQSLIDARIKAALDKALDDMISKGVARALGATPEITPPSPAAEKQLPLTGVPPVVATMLPEPGRPLRPERTKRQMVYPSHINVQVNPHYRGRLPTEGTKTEKKWGAVISYLGQDKMNRTRLSKEVAQILGDSPFQVSGTISHMLRRGQLVMA